MRVFVMPVFGEPDLVYVQIPQQFLDELGLREDDEVNVEIRGATILVTKKEESHVEDNRQTGS